MKSTKKTVQNVEDAGAINQSVLKTAKKGASKASSISNTTNATIEIEKILISVIDRTTYDVSAFFNDGEKKVIGKIDAPTIHNFANFFDNMAHQAVASKLGTPISRTPPPRPPKIIDINL